MFLCLGASPCRGGMSTVKADVITPEDALRGIELPGSTEEAHRAGREVLPSQEVQYAEVKSGEA